MEKVKLKDLEESFEKIVVPTEEVVEVKKGKKRNAERNFSQAIYL
jgi:transcriptional antiterminator NusG